MIEWSDKLMCKVGAQLRGGSLCEEFKNHPPLNQLSIPQFPPHKE